MSTYKIHDLIGRRAWEYRDEETGDDLFVLRLTDGNIFRFYHIQDCCESVYLADIVGDLDDLLGAEILDAEETIDSGSNGNYGSYTWTFYRIQTTKGHLTIRFNGESNGYYSESVNYSLEEDPDRAGYSLYKKELLDKMTAGRREVDTPNARRM